MHTIIHRPQFQTFPAKPKPDFRSPHYECRDLPQALKLAVYIPGVDASGIELTTQETDLVVTARKAQHVRVNWQALHLESAQRDYQLKLRLGASYDFDHLRASVAKGVLTIVLPKRRPAIADHPASQRQVA
ncbi:MAG: Hsp20/alpha crystallin family protein [Oleiharenicola lentus]